MRASKYKLLATKKLSVPVREKLLAAGFCLDEVEFIKAEQLPIRVEKNLENIILTSSNALKSLLQQVPVNRLKKSFFYVVGNHLQQELLALELRVEVTKPYGEQLGEAIIKNHFTKSFIYFSGNLRREVLTKMLKLHGINFEEEMAYRTVLNPFKTKCKFDAILFFSPSGVSSFLTNNTLAEETCFCIGKTTAAALAGKTQNILVAETPNIESLTDLCIHHF